jgi:hypothetical protein
VPVVDVERLGTASVVFMSMLSNHISWYDSPIGRGIEYKSRAILRARQYQQATSQGL